VQAYKRKNKRLPKAEELAEETEFDKADIKKYLETGYGQRMVTTESETVCQNKAVKAGLSPETQFIHHEARKILWDCIEKLQPKMKMMFIRHEFDELSFKKLYRQLNINDSSFSTFKRRYKKNVYESVENCVSSQYEF
jgi:DNA-directed RNA polymerase specialized sigma subunit